MTKLKSCSRQFDSWAKPGTKDLTPEQSIVMILLILHYVIAQRLKKKQQHQ